jgi:pectin methylesterase-like acyl-CoA thioesterase
MQHPAIRVLSALAASAALAILGLVAAGGAATAVPGTLYVSPSGSAANSDTSRTTARYSTIQQAVNAARPGDTVVACAGTYHEQVSIAVPHLTVAGAGTSNTVIEPTAATRRPPIPTRTGTASPRRRSCTSPPGRPGHYLRPIRAGLDAQPVLRDHRLRRRLRGRLV